MDTYTTTIAVASIVTSGITISIGVIGPALSEGRSVAIALSSLAQQPDASATITRTLFVGLAMIEGDPVDEAYLRQGKWEVDIAGKIYPAEVSARPLYDPAMQRIKA